MKIKYYEFTVTTNCGQHTVIACDHESAKADVLQAFTGCEVVQVSCREEV